MKRYDILEAVVKIAEVLVCGTDGAEIGGTISNL